MSVGFALLFTPLFTVSLSSVRPELYSHGSAVLGSLQQVAGAAGVALFVALMSAQTARLAAAGATPLEALAGGIRAAFLCGAVCALARRRVRVLRSQARHARDARRALTRAGGERDRRVRENIRNVPPAEKQRALVIDHCGRAGDRFALVERAGAKLAGCDRRHLRAFGSAGRCRSAAVVGRATANLSAVRAAALRRPHPAAARARPARQRRQRGGPGEQRAASRRSPRAKACSSPRCKPKAAAGTCRWPTAVPTTWRTLPT